MDALSAALLFVAVMVFGASPAYAYIDPGSGSMLVQLLTGGVAGAIVLARLYWRRLKDKVTRKRAGSDSASTSTDTPDRQ